MLPEFCIDEKSAIVILISRVPEARLIHIRRQGDLYIAEAVIRGNLTINLRVTCSGEIPLTDRLKLTLVRGVVLARCARCRRLLLHILQLPLTLLQLGLHKVRAVLSQLHQRLHV